MADLDPTLPLAGIATTHPTLAITPQQNAQDAATLAQTQAGTQLTQEQAQGLDLQNQNAQQHPQNGKINAQAYLNVWNKTKQSAMQPQTANTGAITSPLSNTAGSAIANTTPGVIDPSSPPP